IPKHRAEELCELMDKLLINSLELVERDVQLSQDIERLTTDGQMDLAHTRFTKGPNAVSAVQLPAEDYKPFRALRTLAVGPDESAGSIPHMALESHPVNAEEERIDPASWFGILRPPTLNSAKEKFTRSLETIVERANVRVTLAHYLSMFATLNKQKSND
uniref:Vacuolar ATPase assembly protein VMA22 n=1 Tax=Anopheles atroparvus TaxID=41427 RepID=A0AAG5CYI7_ANOAO